MLVFDKLMQRRVAEIEQVAANRKVVAGERLKELPPDDVVARVALLATLLGIDVVEALNARAPLPMPQKQ